jgi:hypothetical protein
MRNNFSRFFCVSFALFFFGALAALDYNEIKEFSREDFFNEYNEPISPSGCPSWFNLAYYLDKNALYNKLHYALKDTTLSHEKLNTISHEVASESFKRCYFKPTAQTLVLLACDYGILFGIDSIPTGAHGHLRALDIARESFYGSFNTIFESLNLVALYNIWANPTPQLWH